MTTNERLDFSFHSVCKGQFKHQTGDKGGGCFGYDNTDSISFCDVSDAGTEYVFFNEFGCKGKIVGSGKNAKAFDPPIRVSSIGLKCPPGT